MMVMMADDDYEDGGDAGAQMAAQMNVIAMEKPNRKRNRRRSYLNRFDRMKVNRSMSNN